MTAGTAKRGPRATPSFRTWTIVALLALGALLRLAYLVEARRSPDFDAPLVDAAYHDYWARALVTGNWEPSAPYPDPEIRTTPYFRPPGYPVLLAALYALFGGSFLAARAAQMLLGLASCLLALRFARRWFGTPTDLILLALMVTYWGFIYFEGELLEPPLLVLLTLALLAVAASWVDGVTKGRAAAAGALLGLGALARPNLLLFSPVLLAWGVWVSRRAGTLRRLPVPAVLFLLSLAGALAPAAVRNYRASGELVIISTNGGINLFIGNNAGANGLVTDEIPTFGRFATCFDYPQLVRTVEERLGRRLTHSEASRYFTGLAWSYIRENPGRALALTGKKFLLFWGPLEVSHNKEDEIAREHSAILRLLPLRFAQVLGLAAPAVILLLLRPGGLPRRVAPSAGEEPPRQEIAALLVLFVASFSGSYLPFFVAGRYRVPVVPVLMLFAAYALRLAAAWLSGRCWRRGGLWVTALLASCAIAAVNVTGYRPDPARWFYDRGATYAGKDNWRAAAAEFERAIQMNPKYVQAYSGLGSAWAQQGDFAKARSNWEAAVRLNPRYPDSRYQLGLLLAREGHCEEAAEHFRGALEAGNNLWWIHYALGMTYKALGNEALAADELHAAERLEPHRAEISRELAALAGRSGRGMSRSPGN